LTSRDSEKLLTPLGYVAGVVAALIPWEVATIGIVAAGVAVIAFSAFHAFFTVGFFIVILLGLILESRMHWLLAAAGLLLLPLITSRVSGRSLELPTRRDI